MAQLNIPIANLYARQLAQAFRGDKDSNYISDTRKIASLYTSRMACALALEGSGLDVTESEFDQFKKDAQDLNDGPANLVKKPWYFFAPKLHLYLDEDGRTFKRAADSVMNLIRKIIKVRLAEAIANEENRKSGSFVSILVNQHLEDPELMSFEEMEGQISLYLGAGNDTTLAATTFTLYLLGRPENMAYQEKVHKELDEVLGNKTEITADMVNQMQVLERALKESMRLFPPVNSMWRKITAPLKVNGYWIPKDTQVLISAYNVHRDKKYWGDNVEEFDPSRFENKLDPYQYVAFSAGIRNCIGQRQAVKSAMILLAHALRDSRVESFKPREKVRITNRIVMDTVEPLDIRFTKRSKLIENIENNTPSL
jgi:cytochrome P450